MPQRFNGSLMGTPESETWEARLAPRNAAGTYALACHACLRRRTAAESERQQRLQALIRELHAPRRALPRAHAQLGSLSQSSGGLRAWLLTSAGMGGAPGL